MSFLLLSLLVLPLAVVSRQVDVYHRLHIPNGPETEFVERGSVVVEDPLSGSYRSSESSSQHFSQFASALQAVSEKDREGALYQVALERNGNYDISSVKWCHISQIDSETLILHTKEASQLSEPYNIDYFVSPVPHNGACPQLSPKLDHLAKLNTSVVFSTPRLSPSPELRMPPPLTPEGKPVEPIPEKSFIQKYWMYLAAAMLALMLTGGPPEEAQGQGGSK